MLSVLVLFAAFVFLAAVAWFDPSLFVTWMQEDAWAEWATVLFFLLASILWIRKTYLSRAESTDWQGRFVLVGYASVACFCLFVAGEEISWGQRLFAFEPPEIFLEANFQQEANLHNLLTHKELAGIPLDSRFLVAFVALGFGLLLPVASWLLGQRILVLSALAPRWRWVAGFVAVAIAELTYPVELTGEAAELGLAMLFAADAIDRSPPWEFSNRLYGATKLAQPLAIPVIVALSALLVPVIEQIVYGTQSELRDRTTSELKLLASDILQASERGDVALTKKRRVHKRLFTAVRSGYMRFGNRSRFLGDQQSPAEAVGEGRRDRKGYYLDPWNNPFWVVYDRDRQILSIYSFGANRRRDTDFRKQRGVVVSDGDDIVVSLRTKS